MDRGKVRVKGKGNKQTAIRSRVDAVSGCLLLLVPALALSDGAAVRSETYFNQGSLEDQWEPLRLGCSGENGLAEYWQGWVGHGVG